jgi:hypothetical protein
MVLNPNRTKPLTHEQIMIVMCTGLFQLGFPFAALYSNVEKPHPAALGASGRRAVDGYIGSYEHTKHCERRFERRCIEFEVTNTRITVTYPDCGICCLQYYQRAFAVYCLLTGDWGRRRSELSAPKKCLNILRHHV